jgi:hypothetical protein
MRRLSAWGIVAALLLVGTAGAELVQVPSEASSAATPLQWVVVVGQVGMVVTGIVGGLGVLARRWWAPRAALAWAAFTTLAGGVATIAYAETPWQATAAAVAGCALVGALVVWLARRATRDVMARETP